MGVAVLSFCAIFLLIASGGLLIFYRETIQARIAAAINPQVKQRSLKIKLQDTGNLLGGMVEHLERVVPRTEAEVSVVQQRLITAGFREDSAVKFFYSAKVLVSASAVCDCSGDGPGRHKPNFYLHCLRGHRVSHTRLRAGKVDFQPASEDSARPA